MRTGDSNQLPAVVDQLSILPHRPFIYLERLVYKLALTRRLEGWLAAVCVKRFAEEKKQTFIFVIEQEAVLQRGCLDRYHVGTVIMMMENNHTFDYLDGGGYFNEDPVGLIIQRGF